MPPGWRSWFNALHACFYGRVCGCENRVCSRGNRARGLPTVPALYCDVDASTGAVSGLLDGVALTYLRTGAASGVAAKHLARANAKTVLIIGCGMQGRAALEAIKAARPSIEKAIFVDNTKEARDAIASCLRGWVSPPSMEGLGSRRGLPQQPGQTSSSLRLLPASPSSMARQCLRGPWFPV